MPEPFDRLLSATADLGAPLAIVDEPALWANADDLVRRAGGVPIRVASKSVRVRSIVERTLARDGFAGVMSYSLDESVWLADLGIDDILLAYPTASANGLAALVQNPKRLDAITLMIDSRESLDLIDRLHPPRARRHRRVHRRRCVPEARPGAPRCPAIARALGRRRGRPGRACRGDGRDSSCAA